MQTGRSKRQTVDCSTPRPCVSHPSFATISSQRRALGHVVHQCCLLSPCPPHVHRTHHRRLHPHVHRKLRSAHTDADGVSDSIASTSPSTAEVTRIAAPIATANQSVHARMTKVDAAASMTETPCRYQQSRHAPFSRPNTAREQGHSAEDRRKRVDESSRRHHHVYTEPFEHIVEADTHSANHATTPMVSPFSNSPGASRRFAFV